jgi:hypothetical protein
MQAAGLERYLSTAEKRLIADNDNVDPSTSAAEPVRKKNGTHNRFAAKRDSDVVVPVNWEGV